MLSGDGVGGDIVTHGVFGEGLEPFATASRTLVAMGRSSSRLGAALAAEEHANTIETWSPVPDIHCVTSGFSAAAIFRSRHSVQPEGPAIR